MTINLENVDLIRERTGVSYKEAKEALEVAGGDVLDAIIMIEEKPKHSENFTKGVHDFGKEFGKGFHGFGGDVMTKLKELVKAGNVSRITLEKEGKVLVDIPVNIGAVSAVLFPPATVVAVIAALATGCSMKILKTDGETIDIKDVTSDAIKQVMDKVDGVMKHDEGCCKDSCKTDEDCCDDESCSDEDCCTDENGCCSPKEETPVETEEVVEEVPEVETPREENVIEIEPKDQ